MTERDTTEALHKWLLSEPGRYVRSWEQRHSSRLTHQVFGYHAIQVGLPEWDFLRHNRILHKWCLVEQADLQTVKHPLVVGVAEALPFATESIDLLVLPHTLETSSDPHQLLREVQRVLVPEGKVVISGFNPWSLWSARDRLPGLDDLLPIAPPVQLSPWRVIDWLELLSFELSDEYLGGYGPLLSDKKWTKRWRFIEHWGAKWWPFLGGVYMLKATKRVSHIRLVGLEWNKQPRSRAQTAMASGRSQWSKTTYSGKHK